MIERGASRLVSVVLPCFQAERFLVEAVDSLLAQSWMELEILALDDGSTDGTRTILEAYAARDARVRVLSSDVNQGLIAVLNRGVAEARGTFIARMDADDVSRPDRIARQVAYLDAHPEVDVVGTAAEQVDGEGRVTRALPVRCRSTAGTRFMAAFATPILHPTFMGRAEVVKAHPYATDPRALHAEDYELFARMAAGGVGMANLEDVMLARRAHAESVSATHEPVQVENFVACARHHLEESLDLRPPHGAHRVLVNRMTRRTSPRDLRGGLELLDRLEAHFAGETPSARAEIRGIADEQRIDVLVQAVRRGAAPLRLAALATLPWYLRSFASERGRAYLASKVPSRSR